jgi:excinuclease UvrABC nuclease subunit
MRGRKRKGTRYYGPFGHAYAIRETVSMLRKSIPVRNCSDQKFREHERLGRPCLEYHIAKCAGPCVGAVDKERYDELVADLCRFFDGDTDPIVRRLEAEMKVAADAMEYEEAARIRDRLTAVRKAIEKQLIVAERSEDIDAIAIADDDLEAAVQVFHVRRGIVVGRNGFVLDKAEDLSPGELVDRVLEGLYGTEPPAASPRSCSSRPSRPTSRCTSGGCPSSGGATWTSACPSAATSARCSRPSSRTPARSSPATGCAGRPTTTAGPGRSTSSRTTSACPTRRCASSATT